MQFYALVSFFSHSNESEECQSNSDRDRSYTATVVISVRDRVNISRQPG